MALENIPVHEIYAEAVSGKHPLSLPPRRLPMEHQYAKILQRAEGEEVKPLLCGHRRRGGWSGRSPFPLEVLCPVPLLMQREAR